MRDRDMCRSWSCRKSGNIAGGGSERPYLGNISESADTKVKVTEGTFD